MSAEVLCLASNGDWRSRSLKNLLWLHSWGRRSDWLLGWAVIYSTDQLLTPYFSGASTLNGTRGRDRWVLVLGGQIGWLLSALDRFDADCAGSTNSKMPTLGKHEKIPPHRKHTTKPTSAQRPRLLETAHEKTRPMR